ncbi:hypothetical protein D6C84_05168 [Aureobasidium pullulans]|uniref:Telomerase reverse transcriptase n=1 Tax=Aureobasidium pullulans TaxID=5580 RepID=A0A4S9XXK1_AURPU|nr:hypothetical protein D6C84_05168 [Aureobasidium pullulans]
MKRKRDSKDTSDSIKRTKASAQQGPDHDHQSAPSILRLYYPQVLTLREYLLQATTSKHKKRRITNYGSGTGSSSQDADAGFVNLLDTVLVGFHTVKKEESDLVDYQNELSIFSTQVTGSEAKSSGSQPVLPFAEIVEFAIWQLFRKHTSGHRPPHVLCHGYWHTGLGEVKIADREKVENNHGAEATLPDRNEHVDRLKGEAWAALPSLVGAGSALILVQLLQNCGMFIPLDGGKNNYLQISDILNRIRRDEELDKNAHMLKYIFPRQFGLHNVFTNDVDTKNSAQPFKDYTLREQEIKSGNKNLKQRSLPKRLRGKCETLINQLRMRHERCAYSALLQYYCPDSFAKENSANDGSDNIMGLATSSSQVSAYCRSVIAKVFPGHLWGEGELGAVNKAHVMHQIDRFVRLGRYESLMLHEVAQNIKISRISWLRPPDEMEGCKLAASDFNKRKDMFAELLYYLFDSFLIPLISSNFYVTESSTYRNRLLYFRHDVWQKLSEPALKSLGTTMFEEVGKSTVKKTLSNMSIGTGRVRLLPKESGLRPIINLKRRVQTKRNGRLVLGKSVNKILEPAFHVLNLEKAITPAKLGSSMFSSDEMYQRLHRFRTQLQQSENADKPLYFAKVDVQSCFDSIPQKPLLKLLNDLISAEGYTITRYAQAKTLGECDQSEDRPKVVPKASWKWKGKARVTDQKELFSEHAQKEAEASLGTVFVDLEGKTHRSRAGILALLREHIERNIVQIGKKFYRQTTGIPQGSIVSSLLCNFFYAELESKSLAFLQDDESLLLRLIDDFLLISTNRDTATRFVQVMHRGLPEYGLRVKEDKSKVNFDVQVDGRDVSRLPAATNFPYCGNAINTINLNIIRDEIRRQQNNTAAALTVDFSRSPGQNFYRKTFNMLKLHMHTMHLCTRHNNVETAIANVSRMFADTAERCFNYIRCLSQTKKPSTALIIKTIDDLIHVAYGLMKRKREKKSSDVEYACALSKAQTRW